MQTRNSLQNTAQIWLKTVHFLIQISKFHFATLQMANPQIFKINQQKWVRKIDDRKECDREV